jgi:nucleotide-binding universal stress UspA family protein
MRFSPRKILLPVGPFEEADSGDMSSLALEAVVDLAKRFDSEVVLLTVAVPPTGLGLGDLPTAVSEVVEEVRDAQRSYAKEKLDELAATAREEGVEISARVVIGTQVARYIVETAEEEKVDVIALPSHDRRGVKRLLLGSVAERVAHLAHMPVLLLHPPKEPAVSALRQAIVEPRVP